MSTSLCRTERSFYSNRFFRLALLLTKSMTTATTFKRLLEVERKEGARESKSEQRMSRRRKWETDMQIPNKRVKCKVRLLFNVMTKFQWNHMRYAWAWNHFKHTIENWAVTFKWLALATNSNANRNNSAFHYLTEMNSTIDCWFPIWLNINWHCCQIKSNQQSTVWCDKRSLCYSTIHFIESCIHYQSNGSTI